VGEVTCYAESPTGIAWTKPSLGICAYAGSTKTNIIWNRFGAHTFMPFKDSNPDALPTQRYKALASGPPTRPIKRVMGLASEDGVHWAPMWDEPIIIQESVDFGADLAFWDAEQEQYVAYLRGWRTHVGSGPVNRDELRRPDGSLPPRAIFRQVLRCTSRDFRHWTQPEFIDFCDTPLEHFYTNAVTPYYRAPHIYLAFPKRFVPERKTRPDHPAPGLSDTVLLSSRDGMHFDRTFMEAFIRPGLDPDNWTDRNMMTAWGIVPTERDEISLYYVENYRHATCRLRRATLRTDGFASVHAGYRTGEWRTKPLTFEGESLAINCSTSAVGGIKIELQDAVGRPLPGYGLQDCPEIYGDEIEHVVSWEKGQDVSQLARQPVRLRFSMKDADLYSLRFRRGPG
jgi:hypothetical protein